MIYREVTWEERVDFLNKIEEARGSCVRHVVKGYGPSAYVIKRYLWWLPLVALGKRLFVFMFGE